MKLLLYLDLPPPWPIIMHIEISLLFCCFFCRYFSTIVYGLGGFPKQPTLGVTPFSLSSAGWNLVVKFEGPNLYSIVFLFNLGTTAREVLGAIDPKTKRLGSATEVIGFVTILVAKPSFDYLLVLLFSTLHRLAHAT
jgi:hypothetical protein